MKTRTVVNKGKGTQPKSERNEQLAKDYKSDMYMADLVAKYRVSSTRIYDILRRMGVSRRKSAD